MKISSCILFLFISFLVQAQNKLFLNHVHESESVFYNDQLQPSVDRIDVLNFNADYLSGLFVSALKQERSRRFKSELVQDSLLNRIAQSCISTFARSKFTYGKIWSAEKQNIKYALQREESKYKLYSAHAFCLDMLDLKFATPFHYDDKIGKSNTNLYYGRKAKSLDTDNPEVMEEEPVESITEMQFAERIIDFFSKGAYRKDFLSKKFTRVGVALKIDKHSINRNERPRIFVVVIFGGKQLQTIKVPRGMMNDEENKLEE